MKLSRVLVIVSMLLAGMLSGTAEAVMVDFELPDYTAGSTFDGVDGWDNYPNYAGSVVVTPGGGDTTVLSGSQSGRITGIGQPASLSIMARQFDAGPTEFGSGSIISGHMMASGGAGGRAEFFYSDDPYHGTSPCGISANIGGNFDIFGKVGVGADNIPTAIPFLSNKDYLLELELNLDTQGFTAYATNVTDGGARTKLGTGTMQSALPITPAMYATSGHAIVTRGDAIAIYDDLDVYVAPVTPPVPLLPEPVNFENSVYVAGSSVVGVDGWKEAVWVATTEVVNTNVLAGTKSLKLGGTSTALQRNFGPDITYEDGSIMSAHMKMLSSATQEGTAEFHFSHNQTALMTPAGIIGKDDGNFWIFGKQNGQIVTPDGIDTGIPFVTGAEYLLEMQFDFTNQIFYSYATDLTNNGQRTMLGAAEFWVPADAPVAPGDDTNSGYVIISRQNAEVLYDELNLVPGTLPEFKPGDANRNGSIDQYDAALLAANWLAGPDATWAMGDFNEDGYVNDLDATLMATNWTTAGSASVPEPSTLVALLGLCLGVSFIRRGK